MSWLVIGISGVSCSGKTSLAESIKKVFSDPVLREKYFPKILINQVQTVCQDDFFWPLNHPKHVWIKELNHINRERLNAIDMETMCQTIRDIIGNDTTSTHETNAVVGPNGLNILIIEGFLIFNYKFTTDLCQVKICFKISFEECFKRRKVRLYKQPTPPGYFEKYVWPVYNTYFDEYRSTEHLLVLNGGETKDNCTEMALEHIKSFIEMS